MDRVQVLKRESALGGGDDADTQPWDEPIEAQEDALEAAGVFLQDPSNYDENVLISRSGNDMTFRDVTNPVPKTLTDLLAGGSGGISEAQHETLDTIVHDIAETSYDEVTYSGRRLTSTVTWDSAAKTTKIREVLLTYTGNRVTQVVTNQYDASGTLKNTLTEVFNYVGGSRRVSSITRTKL